MTNNYWKVMPGSGGNLIRQANSCFRDEYIGIDFLDDCELTAGLISNQDKLREKCRDYFENIPQGNTSEKKIENAINSAFKAFDDLFNKIDIGHIILSPDGYGNYAIGKVEGSYKYKNDRDEKNRLVLPHRRRVNWLLDKGIPRSKMSESLHKALTARSGTTSKLGEECHEKCHEELRMIIDGSEISWKKFRFAQLNPSYIATTEKLLGDDLQMCWANSSLANRYDLKNVQGIVPREFPTQAGKIDFLATSKDQAEYLVIELKRCESENAVSQVLRYMEQVRLMLQVDRSRVKGCIIGHGEDDNTLCAMEALNEFCGSGCVDIEFYCYEIKESDDGSTTSKLGFRKVGLRL